MPFPIGSLSGAIERGVKAYNDVKAQRNQDADLALKTARQESDLETDKLQRQRLGLGNEEAQAQLVANKQAREQAALDQAALHIENGDVDAASGVVEGPFGKGAKVVLGPVKTRIEDRWGNTIKTFDTGAIYRHAENLRAGLEKIRAETAHTNAQTGLAGPQADLMKAHANYYNRVTEDLKAQAGEDSKEKQRVDHILEIYKAQMASTHPTVYGGEFDPVNANIQIRGLVQLGKLLSDPKHRNDNAGSLIGRTLEIISTKDENAPDAGGPGVHEKAAGPPAPPAFPRRGLGLASPPQAPVEAPTGPPPMDLPPFNNKMQPWDMPQSMVPNAADPSVESLGLNNAGQPDALGEFDAMAAARRKARLYGAPGSTLMASAAGGQVRKQGRFGSRLIR